MKKRLLYLSAFLSIALAFSACSEDEVPGWKKIPSEEIKGENATLSLNGQPSRGSIQFSVLDETSAELKLNNIVHGYETMPMNVTLMQKQDGSFDFTGENTFSSASVRAEGAVTTKVIVKGNVTLENKATVEVKVELSGGITANWLLADITMPNDAGTRFEHAPSYLLWSAPKHKITSGLFKGSVISELLASVAQWFLPAVLSDALHQVKFNADGNVTAKYYSGTEYTMEWIFEHQMQIIPTTGKTWLDSPTNLAYWYIKGDKLYIVPNIGSIMTQIGKDNTRADGMDFSVILEMLKGMTGAEVKKMLAELMPKDFPLDLSKLSDAKIEEVIGWLSTGIPLSYSTEQVELGKDKKATCLRVFVDQDFVEPFMPLLFPMLPMLDEMMKESAPGLYPSLNMMGISSLTEIEKIWKDTEDFKIGIELADKSFN